MIRGHLAGPLTALPIATLAAFLMSSSSVLAADVAAPSKIDAVTVFPAGAEVTRVAQVKLVAGEHAIILDDLPATAIPSSIDQWRRRHASSVAAGHQRRKCRFHDDEPEQARHRR